MLQDLAALTPPAIVCAAVLIGAWAIVRRELAPKRRERAEATAADEERAVDREQRRSLYFPTSVIYLRSRIGYRVSAAASLEKSCRHLIRPFETDSADDNVRLGDMLTVHLLSRHVARCSAALAVSLGAYSVHQEVRPPELCGAWAGYMLMR
jgi:hypothetical protein